MFDNGNIAPFGIIGGRNASDFAQLNEAATQSEVLQKALVTGNTVVQPNATGAQALREQFLLDYLEQVSFEQDDARMMKLIKLKKVPSTAVEWSDFNAYGSAGDDFVGESGLTGNFDVGGADDNFLRQVQQVKFMATSREIGVVAQHVNNLSNPVAAATKGGTLEIVSKMNLASYYADSTTNVLHFNGFEAQLKQWLALFPADTDILFDAQGQPMSKDLMLDVAKTCRKKFGKPSLLMQSVDTYADSQKLLFPEARTGENVAGGTYGGYNDYYSTKYGRIKLEEDVMLRSNRPLVADGNGLDGKPRNTSTQDSGALVFGATPFASVIPTTPGTAPFYQYATNNGSLAQVPSSPGKPALPTQFSKTSNQLGAGNYYYAISPVYYGREGAAWVFGEAAAGVFTGASPVTVTTANPVVALTLTSAPTATITGLGTTYPYGITKFRVYRASSTAVSLSDFDFLGECGITPTGAAIFYDNGYSVPGSDTAFMFTEAKNGSDGFFMAQLLPLMKRALPQTAMSDRFALLAFVTPIVKVPRHHIVIRNIGKV